MSYVKGLRMWYDIVNVDYEGDLVLDKKKTQTEEYNIKRFQKKIHCWHKTVIEVGFLFSTVNHNWHNFNWVTQSKSIINWFKQNQSKFEFVFFDLLLSCSTCNNC